MDPARLLMISLAGPELTPDERALLGERTLAGVCLFSRNCLGRVQVAELTAEVRALTGEDALIAIDQEGGSVVRLRDVPFPPPAMALGAADDLALTRAVAAATGRGLRAAGVNVDFAPVADVNLDPANPVIADRAFGGDPERVARHVVAFVNGLQGEGVAATVKHFPGHGDVAVDSHLDLPLLPFERARLERVELAPFRAAIAAGVAGVMSGHLRVPALEPDDLPATLSPTVMRDLLRGELGFRGVTFSDALDMRAVADRWGAGEAAVLAVAAGIDVVERVAPFTEHRAACDALDRALAEGRLESARITEAGERVDALARRFPAQPDPDAAWHDGDDALLDDAAARGLVALGALPRLAAGQRVMLLAAARVAAGAASDGAADPAAALAAALEARGVRVDARRYDAAAPDPALLAGTEDADALLYASTARVRMPEPELRFARAAAARAGRFAHVALWNPFHAGDLPGPALIAFGFGPRQIAAAAAALCGAAVTGIPPAPLTVAAAEGT